MRARIIALWKDSTEKRAPEFNNESYGKFLIDNGGDQSTDADEALVRFGYDTAIGPDMKPSYPQK